jgi:hypothetical protein
MKGIDAAVVAPIALALLTTSFEGRGQIPAVAASRWRRSPPSVPYMCVLTRLINVALPWDMRRLAAEDAVAESKQRIRGVERHVASTLRDGFHR